LAGSPAATSELFGEPGIQSPPNGWGCAAGVNTVGTAKDVAITGAAGKTSGASGMEAARNDGRGAWMAFAKRRQDAGAERIRRRRTERPAEPPPSGGHDGRSAEGGPTVIAQHNQSS